ncbi:MAG: 1-deoxy-D-xylulose-5-phosphate reductoisomerase [Bradyrhizobiaceae bacterium]|nr:1-deoxy-D-xylulose-5-phosphate reductoisomerase [Bradyrhizobiaceae bacterium]
MPRTITILGSTGSIGTQTLEVLDTLSAQGAGDHADTFVVRWLTCNTRVADLVPQVRKYKPYGVAIRDEAACAQFKSLCPDFTGPVLCGEEGLCEAAADPANTIVMSAMVGFSGVVPTVVAIRAGHPIALANKESLVSAGEYITGIAREQGVPILAVDSEHSAIAQCLVGEELKSISRIVLTASGGPFLNTSTEQLDDVSPEQALKHPNWMMGAKITIDSATLMNKGFEVIEARWLFGVHASQIDVVVHPQSIIHSLVEFVDGSVKAQLGIPTMHIPIQYALTYPRRLASPVQPMSLTKLGSLTFFEPDHQRFPCLKLAFDALEAGGTAGCIVNAANEVAVHAFLNKHIRFTEIPRVIERTLESMKNQQNPSLPTILETDAEARIIATHLTTSRLVSQ